MAEDKFQINDKPIQDSVNDTDAFLLQEDDAETKRAFGSAIWNFIKNKLKAIPSVIDHKMLINIGNNDHDSIDSFISTAPIIFATTAQGKKADTALQPTSDGSGLINMVKSQVGLSEVDNTSDANKPVSAASQEAIDKKENLLITSRVLWVDSNRTDTYVKNGSIARPLKSISEALTLINSESYTTVTINLVCGTYSEGTSIVLPAITLILNGNGSSITSDIMSSCNKAIINNVTVANFTDSSSSSVATFRNVTVTGLFIITGRSKIVESDIIGTSVFSSSSDVTIDSSRYSASISSDGILKIHNSDILLSAATADGAIVSISGGSCLIENNTIIVLGGGNAISCDNGAAGYATNGRINIISNNKIYAKDTAYAIVCNAASTVISKNIILSGLVLGSGLQPINNDIIGSSKIALGSDVTGDIYYRDSNGNFTRLGIGTNKQLLLSTGSVPSWKDLSESLSGIPFISQAPNSNIPNAQSLSLLNTGVLKSTHGTGIVSIATCDDLLDGTNYHLITSAQRLLLNNTSGVNTGDQVDIAGNAATATVAETANKLDKSLSINGVSYNGSSEVAMTLATIEEAIRYSIVLG